MTATPRQRDSSDDETEDLPRTDGPTDEALALDDDAPDEVDERSWLDEDGTMGVEIAGDGVDELDEASALDDTTLAIDDDPLELDPESTFTEGSEAATDLRTPYVPELGELDDLDVDASVDDGSEGFEADALDVRESEEAHTVPGDRGLEDRDSDDLASDLSMSEATTLHEGDLALDEEPTFGLAVLDGELVRAHLRAVRIGAMRWPVALGPGEALRGVVALDEQRLVLWSDTRTLLLTALDGDVEALPVTFAHACSDGEGGLWTVDARGEVSWIAKTHFGLSAPAEVVGRLPGAQQIAASRRDPDAAYLIGRGLREGDEGVLLRLEGEPRRIALPGPARALTVDDDGALLVALDTEIVRLDPHAPAVVCRVAALGPGPQVTAIAEVDRMLVVLRGEHATVLARHAS